MKIAFRDRKLEKLANDDRKRLAAMGKNDLTVLTSDLLTFLKAKIWKKVEVYTVTTMTYWPQKRAMGLRFRSTV